MRKNSVKVYYICYFYYRFKMASTLSYKIKISFPRTEQKLELLTNTGENTLEYIFSGK